MNALRLRLLLPIAVLFCVSAPNPAWPQAPLEPAQMSPRTAFYVIWRGVPGAKARQANSLLALWDDPDFAPVRSALAAGMLNSSTEKTGQHKLTREELQEFAGLLENSFTLGYMSEPVRRTLSNGAVATDTRNLAWNGMFFVYDRTGKEELLSKTVLRLRKEETEAPQLSQISVGDVQVLKAEGKNSISYWAEHGKYAVSAGDRFVMEDILGRLEGKASGTASLAQSPAYQEAQGNLGGLLEFFLRIADLEKFAADSQAGTLQVQPLLDAARLDAVHSVSGHVTFEGAKTHVQAAILGDTARGTPFDIWSAGQRSPASLSFVSADAVAYTSTQLNLQGIYDTVKRVARAAFPQAQQGNTDLLDAIAQQKLGMPVPNALGAFTGDFGSMQTSPAMESAKQVYFFGIRKKPETLQLLRAVFSDQLSSERNEGDITFLKISLGGKQGSAGTAQWNFFNLAVTSDMVLGSSRLETLREALSNRARISPATGLAAVPQFQAGRAQFPENLSGLSYFDFQKADWQALKDRWIEEEKKNPVAKSVNASKDTLPSTSTALDWLAQINPQVVPRHLHYSSSVSWKDSKGIHWDQWVE